MNYRLRRERARQVMLEKGLTHLILTGPSDLLYLCGQAWPGAGLILTREESWLLLPPGGEEQAVRLSREFRLFIVKEGLGAELKRKVFGVPPDRVWVEPPRWGVGAEQTPAWVQGTDWRVGPLVARLRSVKEPEELEVIRKGQEISDQAMEQVRAELLPGVTEQEVALRLEALVREAGAQASPFPTMVAFGKATGQLHGPATDRRLQPGDPVQIDFGVRWEDYCTDTARLLCCGEPSPLLHRLYRTVVEAKEAVLRRATPGTLVEELHRVANQVLQEAGFGEYFRHYVGHGVGLDVHEAPSVCEGNRLALEPDMVLSVEPGICMTGRFGARIEGLIRIGSDPAEVLSRLDWRELQILPE